ARSRVCVCAFCAQEYYELRSMNCSPVRGQGPEAKPVGPIIRSPCGGEERNLPLTIFNLQIH
ncbi:hypothetical protein J6590_107764, partial [Homalodisca vitripennis]